MSTRVVCPACSPLVALARFVPSFRVGERFRLPGKPFNAVMYRGQEDVFITQTRQVKVPGHILDELLDADMITPPERDAVQLMPQTRTAELHHQ